MRANSYSVIRIRINHASGLTALLLLFVFRVLAQLLQAIAPVDVLPEFHQWQGSGIPYPLLLVVQLFIIAVAARIIHGIQAGTMKPQIHTGRILLVIGVMYFVVMLARLLLGLTLLTTVSWFAKLIPAFFHLVLACMVLLVGHYHFSTGRQGPGA